MITGVFEYLGKSVTVWGRLWTHLSNLTQPFVKITLPHMLRRGKKLFCHTFHLEKSLCPGYLISSLVSSTNNARSPKCFEVWIQPPQAKFSTAVKREIKIFSRSNDFGGNAHRGTRRYSMQSFGGHFHSKITWAGAGLIEGCNRKIQVCSCYLFIEMKCTRGRYCKDWKYKNLKLKRCRQRIWLWGKTGRQNSPSKLNLIGC